MADPWDDDLEQTMQQGDPWDDDLTATDASTPSKSARVAKNLSIFGGRFDPIGSAETILAVGSGMANEAARGLAGIAGTAMGMVPGGESPNEKGSRYLEAVPDFTYEPKTQGGQAGQEMLNAGMEKGLEGAKYVGSGYAGLGAMAAGADATEATQSMQDFRETPNAMGEGVFEYTQSPTMAVVAQLLPEVAASLSPIKKPKVRAPGPRMTPDMPPQGFGGVGDVEVPRGTQTGPRGVPADAATKSVFDQLRDAISAGDKAKIMELTKANPAIVAAFEQLDIDFTPGAVSESMPIRQTEAALGSKVDSNIPTMHKQMETDLNQAARDLIDEAGGDYGRASNVASDIEARYNEIEANYIKQGDAIWKEIEDQVKAKGVDAMPVDAESAANQVRTAAENAGRNGNIDDGLKRLSRQERELFEMTHEKVQVENRVPDPTNPGEFITEIVDEWQYTQPKYSAIDRFRRSLLEGQSGVGPFRAESPGRLKMLYGQMAEIQKRVAKGNGFGDLWETGNNLIKDRKVFEEGMQRTLGRGLNQSVLTRLSSATNALLKNNDVKKWDQLMKDLPADQRTAAAAQALENVFFTAGKGTKMSDSFVKNFEKIMRDPAIRDRLIGDMTPENRATFMALGEAATGFYRMMDKALSNPSGTGVTNYVLKRLQEPGFMQTVIGGFADRATGRIPVIRDWAQTVLRRTPEQQTAQAANRLNAAANLLTDPALRRAIVEYAKGGVEAANKILADSQTWAEWVKLQPIPAQERLMSAGIVALFEEDTEE
jgi:L-rhamnose mutarotase